MLGHDFHEGFDIKWIIFTPIEYKLTESIQFTAMSFNFIDISLLVVYKSSHISSQIFKGFDLGWPHFRYIGKRCQQFTATAIVGYCLVQLWH